MLVLFAACSDYRQDPPASGLASGTFDTEIFVPGSNPPNFGAAAIDVTMDGAPRTLAQGASAVAIDAEGRPNLDPDQAVYFALQVFQYIDDSTAEVFELRVSPAEWVDGAVVPINTDEADALFGLVYFDLNGQQQSADILLTAVRGELTLEAAGRDPGDDVRGSLADLEMTGP